MASPAMVVLATTLMNAKVKYFPEILKLLQGTYCGRGYFCLNLPGTFACTDIDECKKGSHKCQGPCSNTVGSYECLDVDECSEKTHKCSQNTQEAECVNLLGGYSCNCPEGS